MLKEELKDLYEVCPIELSGRGKRIRESLCNDFNEAVENLYLELRTAVSMRDRYVILGHSLGSWLAYSLYLKIRTKKYNQPMHMFFSGNNPPIYGTKNERISDLKDDEFFQAIYKLGGINELIYENKELRNFYLPILRSDFRLLETSCTNFVQPKIECDISVMIGNDDKITNSSVCNWKNFTEKQCDFKYFEGGHFFLYEQCKNVSAYIQQRLSANRTWQNSVNVQI
jgi:surfactin synthase thioesterase subunit